MSPEVVTNTGPFDGFAVDMWAVGVTLFIMLTGVPPFDQASAVDGRFLAVTNGGLEAMLTSWGMPVSGAAGDLLQNMMWKEPERRLTLEQVVTHRWVLDPDIDVP